MPFRRYRSKKLLLRVINALHKWHLKLRGTKKSTQRFSRKFSAKYHDLKGSPISNIGKSNILYKFRYINTYLSPSTSIGDEFIEEVPASSKVDFYIFLQSDNSDWPNLDMLCARKKIWANHLELDKVLPCPVVFPIKTKASSKDRNEAWNQLANMQTAQWLWLCSQGLPNLDYLLGILVDDDRWYVSVYVPRTNGLNTLFIGLPLGGRSDLAEMYKLLATLETLKEWSEEVYSPFVKNHMFQE